MITIEEAFAKFKSRQELTDREQEDVSRRHKRIRKFVGEGVQLETSFLTGSYKRWTKTRPLRDVDIFCVLHEDEFHFREEHPRKILAHVKKTLEPTYGEDRVVVDRMAVRVDFGVSITEEEDTDGKVVSVELVPAFPKDEHYEIPDELTGEWFETNPKIHEQLAIDAHDEYDNEWKPLIRMIKKWNEFHGKPIKSSFLIEVMALKLLNPPFSGGYPYEIKGFFANAAEHIFVEWEDPAGLGPPVSGIMTSSDKINAQNALLAAEDSVTKAILLAKDGKNGEALRKWRELFGPQFPLS